jgi:lipopolysaccharide export LptBFGC system permease protein LptF
VSSGVRIIERYILLELAKSFIAACVVITSLMTLVTGVLFLQHHMVSAALTLKATPYLIALEMWLVLPFSYLLAATLTYHRLSAQNEVLAVEMTGTSLVRVFAPGVLFGVLVALACLAFNGYLQPWAKTALRAMAQDNMAQIMASVLRNKNEYVLPGGRVWFTWKRFTKPNVIHEVNFFKLDNKGNPKLAVHAQMAHVSVVDSEGSSFRCVLHDSKGQYEQLTLDGKEIIFKEKIVDPRRRDLHEHTMLGLYRELDAVVRTRAGLLVAEAKALELKQNPPELRDRDLDDATVRSGYEKIQSACSNSAGDYLKQLYEVRSKIHARNALSLMPIVFAMIGIPLAVRLRHWHMLVAFALALIVAFLFYITPLLIFRMAAEYRGWAPWLMQVPNVVVGLAGLGFMARMTLR